MLTPQHKAYFDTFGFLSMRKVFSDDEIQAIKREADALLEQDREGQPLRGQRQRVAPFVELRPLLTQLVEDDRIYKVIESLLGPDFLWGGSEGVLAVDAPGFGWHPDRSGEWDADVRRGGEKECDYARIKVMMYLDPTTKDSGALRVIPGSHRLPFFGDLQPLVTHLRLVEAPEETDLARVLFGVDEDALPALTVESEPGDVLFFNQTLFHAVLGGRTSRCFIALKFAANPTTDDQIASVLYYGSHAGIFPPHESFAKSDRPSIRRMVERLTELKPQ